MESLFNKVVGLQAWNFILKRKMLTPILRITCERLPLENVMDKFQHCIGEFYKRLYFL